MLISEALEALFLFFNLEAVSVSSTTYTGTGSCSGGWGLSGTMDLDVVIHDYASALAEGQLHNMVERIIHMAEDDFRAVLQVKVVRIK